MPDGVIVHPHTIILWGHHLHQLELPRCGQDVEDIHSNPLHTWSATHHAGAHHLHDAPPVAAEGTQLGGLGLGARPQLHRLKTALDLSALLDAEAGLEAAAGAGDAQLPWDVVVGGGWLGV